MQQRPQMIPMMSSFPPTNLTTEQIQECLDENKKMILAILDNQNLGKLAECAQWPHIQQCNQGTVCNILRPRQWLSSSKGVFPSKAPPQFGNQHQMPDHNHQQPQPQPQPQAMQGQMGMRPMHEAALGGGPPSNDLRGRNRQKDASVPSSAATIDVESS